MHSSHQQNSMHSSQLEPDTTTCPVSTIRQSPPAAASERRPPESCGSSGRTDLSMSTPLTSWAELRRAELEAGRLTTATLRQPKGGPPGRDRERAKRQPRAVAGEPALNDCKCPPSRQPPPDPAQRPLVYPLVKDQGSLGGAYVPPPSRCCIRRPCVYGRRRGRRRGRGRGR